MMVLRRTILGPCSSTPGSYPSNASPTCSNTEGKQPIRNTRNVSNIDTASTFMKHLLTLSLLTLVQIPTLTTINKLLYLKYKTTCRKMQVRGFHLIYSKTWSSALSITSKKNPDFQATKFCFLPVNWLSWVYNRNCSQSQPSWLSLTGNLSDNKDGPIPLEWDKTKCSRSQGVFVFYIRNSFETGEINC